MNSLKIIGIRLRALRNSLTYGTMLKRIPVIIAAALFWALIYAGSYKTFAYLRAVGGDALCLRLLSMGFFSLMGFLFISGLITSVSCIYMSNDLNFLRALPFDDEDIVWAKSLETVLISSWMLMGFMPPVLFASGAAFSAPFYYYPAVMSVLMLFIFTCTGASMLCAHLLTRIMPARILRNGLIALSIAGFTAVYFLFRTSMPLEPESPVEIIRSVLSFNLDSDLSPHYWAFSVVSSLLTDMRPDYLYALLLVSNAAFLQIASVWAGAMFFGRNIESASYIPSGRAARKSGFYPGKRFALIWKDTRLLWRDPEQWMQLLIIAALAFVYVYNFGSLPFMRISPYVPFLRELLVLVNSTMSGLVLTAVSARFVYPSVSMEGRAFWLLRSSPMSMKSFMASKFYFGFAPVSMLTLSVVVLSNLVLKAGMPAMAVSVFVMLMLCVSVCGLGTGMGALMPKYRNENIASVSMSMSGLLYMLLSAVLTLSTLICAAYPYYIYLKTGAMDLILTIICALTAICMNASAFYFPMRAGVRRLNSEVQEYL